MTDEAQRYTLELNYDEMLMLQTTLWYWMEMLREGQTPQNPQLNRLEQQLSDATLGFGEDVRDKEWWEGIYNPIMRFRNRLVETSTVDLTILSQEGLDEEG